MYHGFGCLSSGLAGDKVYGLRFTAEKQTDNSNFEPLFSPERREERKRRTGTDRRFSGKLICTSGLLCQISKSDRIDNTMRLRTSDGRDRRNQRLKLLDE
jgi:uncharacterized protein YwqG